MKGFLCRFNIFLISSALSLPRLQEKWRPFPPKKESKMVSPDWINQTLKKIRNNAAIDRRIPLSTTPSYSISLGFVKYSRLTVPKTFWKCSPEECIEVATERVFSSVEGRIFNDWTLVLIASLEKFPTLLTVILWLHIKWIPTDSIVSKCLQVASDTTQHNRTPRLSEKNPLLGKGEEWQIHQEDISIVVQEYCYLGCVLLQKDLDLSRMALDRVRKAEVALNAMGPFLRSRPIPLATKWLVGNQIDYHTNVALRS